MEGIRQRKRVANNDEAVPEEKDVHGEKKIHRGTVDLEAGSYWLTRVLFLRFLGFIYLVAFLVSYNQNKELIGDRGLTPARLYLRRVGEEFPSLQERLLRLPTLLWFAGQVSQHGQGGELDTLLDGLALTGMLLSLVVIVRGAANAPIMTALWVLYMSLVNVGQNWFSFGWESQLLETGFLAIWCVPLLSLSRLPSHLPSPALVVWGNRWLIVRIMLGAGLIKVRGDQCWRDLTCMQYFYQTQPNPNPLSYYAHQAPAAWHTFETFGNHVTELLFPLFTFLPYRRAWIFNGCFQIFFQVVLISTGNLSFLNWLTIAPSIWYLDDRFLAPLFYTSTKNKVYQLQEEDKVLAKEGKSRSSRARTVVSLAVGLLLAWLSVPIVANLASSSQTMNRSFDPLRLVNTYGAFGSVTKQRTEVVVEGTLAADPDNPKAIWEEYDFNCKPGALTKAPCMISPYHYRLDWQMWFAAFQKYQQNPWLIHLMGKMLENDPIVDSLLARNPFKIDKGNRAPRHVRARLFLYTFSTPGSPASSRGYWWTRKLVEEYVPPFNLETLKPIYQQFGWRFKGEQ